MKIFKFLTIIIFSFIVLTWPLIPSVVLKPWACKDWQRIIYVSDDPISKRLYCDPTYTPYQEDIDIEVKNGPYFLIKSWKLD